MFKTNRPGSHGQSRYIRGEIVKPSQIQLTENRILVKIDEASDTTEAGIVVTEETVKMEMNLGEFQTGEVVSWGHIASKLALAFEEAETANADKIFAVVLFLHFAGKDIKLEGVPYKILRSEEIFAVITEHDQRPSPND